MKTTVILPTRDRETLLARCLQSLGDQALTPDEVVVVDDGSRDGTGRLLDSLAGRAPFRLEVVSLPSSRGPASARNAGVSVARGEVLAFTDDDCTPSYGWLAAGLDEIGRGADIVTGPTELDPRSRDRAGDFAYGMSISGPDPRFSTCNVFYRRRWIENGGGFREQFYSSDGSHFGEDTDLAWRSIRAGARAAFRSDALVYHAVRERSAKEYLRSRRRLEGLVPLVKSYPEVKAAHFSTWCYSRTHALLYLALAGSAASLAWAPAASLALPYLAWRTRAKRDLFRQPFAFVRRNRALPVLFAGDLYECLILMRASVRHRHLYL